MPRGWIATGRKYLLAFYDRYDTYVTSNFAISVFKMPANEHILFTTSHKAPYAREVQQRGWVTRDSEPAWAITAQEKDWAAFPASTLPYYATGASSGQCSATSEVSDALSPRVARSEPTPLWATMPAGVGVMERANANEPACMLSRHCKVDREAKSALERQTCSNSITTRKVALSSILHDGVAARTVDGNYDMKWGGGSCSHTRARTREHSPWWQIELYGERRVERIILYPRTESNYNFWHQYVPCEHCQSTPAPV